MKSLAVKAGEIKPTPIIFQAPEKLNVLQVYVNHRAFTNCIKITFLAAVEGEEKA